MMRTDYCQEGEQRLVEIFSLGYVDQRIVPKKLSAILENPAVLEHLQNSMRRIRIKVGFSL
jgi:DNA-binding TFAR19-related protein (PDSD5 family)